jgi:broad specificity phosphatase PhoE
MELILIRHGEPITGLDCGPDPALTPLGHAQAAAMATHIGAEPIDTLYVSPQRRALDTASPLATRLGLDPIVDERIAEFDYGDERYISPAEVPDLDPAVVAELIAKMRSPEFTGRVLDALTTITTTHDGGHVALVCHGVVISTMVRHLAETRSLRMRANHTSVTRFVRDDDGRWTLGAFNESHWLPAVAQQHGR